MSRVEVFIHWKKDAINAGSVEQCRLLWLGTRLERMMKRDSFLCFPSPSLTFPKL